MLPFQDNVVLDRGAIYLAFGENYLSMALLSIKTLKEHNPNLSVTLVTNIKIDITSINYMSKSHDYIEFLDYQNSENRKIKTSIVNYTKYEKTIFIDCDTYIISDIGLIFEILDFFDLCMRLNPSSQSAIGKGEKKILEGKFRISEISHWNSGVIAFKNNSKVEHFFGLWNESFIQTNSQFDQISLVEAVFLSRVKLMSLTDEWNYNPNTLYYWGFVKNKKIIHYTNRISHAIIDSISQINHENLDKKREFMAFVKVKLKSRSKKIGKLRFFLIKISWIVRKNIEKKLIENYNNYKS